jgi:hypothetical protein
MRTEIEIIDEMERIEELLKTKEEKREWEDYDYYQERLYTLDWVLNR